MENDILDSESAFLHETITILALNDEKNAQHIFSYTSRLE